MENLELLTGRNYLSYSSLSSWLDCSERFRLERIANAPQSPAWYFIAGDVIHKSTEAADLDDVNDPLVGMEIFRLLWADALEQVEDVNAVRTGGRATREFPGRENHLFWAAKGPQMVADWITYRKNMFNSGWSWYEVDGSPTIEVPVEFTFAEGTESEVQVKGYIDRVLRDRYGNPVVLDLKSGSRTPDSTLQLGVYALGLEQRVGVRPNLGTYYMTRTAYDSGWASLMHYTPRVVGDWFASVKRGIENEVFVPHVTSFCNSCAVSKYCAAVGGDPTLLLAEATAA